ncbi:MAG: xanthine dehydrogenase subunit D, partial [Acidimicrobiales bacterium]
MTVISPPARSRLRRPSGRVGESAPRPDGGPKAQGRFAFSSDLWAEEMLWGHVLRSPHPSATIVSVDLSGALAVPGVAAALGAADIPGRACYGLE